MRLLGVASEEGGAGVDADGVGGVAAWNGLEAGVVVGGRLVVEEGRLGGSGGRREETLAPIDAAATATFFAACNERMEEIRDKNDRGSKVLYGFHDLEMLFRIT